LGTTPADISSDSYIYRGKIIRNRGIGYITMNKYHNSVLLNEVIESLNIHKDGKYIDATLGGGGHSAEIIKNGGIVLAIDTDSESINYVKKNYNFGQDKDRRIIIAKDNFKNIKEIAGKYKFNKVNGIIFDLGVSSHQLDRAERGFSFRQEGPLDMRMNQELNVNAKDLVNGLSKSELIELFTKFGEEPFSRNIAANIIKSRKSKPINTTWDLKDIVYKSVSVQKQKLDSVTRIYQALRIVVNDELNNLRLGLTESFELLESSGRLAVISFHSLEDRIVKKIFTKWDSENRGAIITRKPIRPCIQEINTNNRSRSAKLRVFEKN
jgi:16S rRNA (cytosine1402-N4)-methyltransferase